MLLIIHNLPLNTRYGDVKTLIKDKCGLTEMIVDNLVTEGSSKKVTVGLADEGDAAILMRNVNGLYICNQRLYVEDVRQRKTPGHLYQPDQMSKQYNQEQNNQGIPPLFDNKFSEHQNVVQFQPQPLMTMESQLPPGPPAPNFGLPFYMSAQNQNVGNNLQCMVQYPKLQESVDNEPYEERGMGSDQQYGGRKRDQPMSSDRGPYMDHSPKRVSRWNESDCNSSNGRRGRDRPAMHDDRHDADESCKDKLYRDSTQEYGSNKQRNNNSFQKPFNRSGPNFERPDRSKYREHNEPSRSNDNRNFNAQNHRYNQEREPQRFRENNYSQSRGSDFQSRPSNFSKKRPYESSGKNQYNPPNKKVATNQQSNSQQGYSGSPFSKNYQNRKISSNKPPIRAPMQQNRSQVQSKGQKNTKGQFKYNKQKQANMKPTEEMIARHEAWRVQATSLIATQILNNVGKMRHRKDPVLVTLKACVRARIDVVVGDDISVTLKDMLLYYREKFQDDQAFYSTVCEKAAKGELDEIVTGKKESDAVAAKKGDIKPQLQFIGKPAAKAPSPASTDKLPKYPAGDKKVFQQMKRAQKEEMLNDSLYSLDDEHEKALKEELDTLDELIKQQFENPENETENTLSKFMNDVFVPDFRKILTLHIRKRILDVRTNLSIRVFCQYKAPKREFLEAFLKDYGVVSLRASDKNRNIMIAICDSYENYDALCKKESTVIDDLKVSFKPLHLTGPPLKGSYKKQSIAVAKIRNAKTNNPNHDIDATRKNGRSVNTEVNAGNEGGKSEVIDIQESDANEDSECEIIPLNKSDDVMVVEDNLAKSDDVIVINDHDDKEILVPHKAFATDAESKTTDDIEGPTINKESVTIDNNEAIVENNAEVTVQEVPELLDNHEIADDDLEDF